MNFSYFCSTSTRPNPNPDFEYVHGARWFLRVLIPSNHPASIPMLTCTIHVKYRRTIERYIATCSRPRLWPCSTRNVCPPRTLPGPFDSDENSLETLLLRYWLLIVSPHLELSCDEVRSWISMGSTNAWSSRVDGNVTLVTEIRRRWLLHLNRDLSNFDLYGEWYGYDRN
jgi:hypothetical protein